MDETSSETIRAAINGEDWALKEILERFSEFLDEQATLKTEQPDGTIIEIFDEDLRQTLAAKLIEVIRGMNLEDYPD